MKVSSMLRFFLLLNTIFLISGCSGSMIDRNKSLSLLRTTTILISPFDNNSDTPSAGKTASAMVADLLRVKGFANIHVYSQKKKCNLLDSCQNNMKSLAALRKIAMKRHLQYLITGYVNEWRYKVGLDGEPSVGVGIIVTDVLTGQTVYTTLGSRTGHSWSGLSDTAQQLIKNMLSNVYVRR